tara:strand:- start:35 stop:661 length:627 start_codon:yes stop_codon:yes gene_type:complete
MKECSKCGIEKPLTEFYKDRQKKNGHRSQCKSCTKKLYAENKEEIAKNSAKYYAKNKEKIVKRNAKYYVENKEKFAKYSVKWYTENKEEYAKRYAENKAEEPNCVYQIKNLENNKVYIGETIRGELRWKEHLRDLRGNRHPNKLLQEDFDKYGEQAFEWTILKEFEAEDKNTLLLEEARTIQQFIAEGAELYNLTLTIDQLRMLTENK